MHFGGYFQIHIEHSKEFVELRFTIIFQTLWCFDDNIRYESGNISFEKWASTTLDQICQYHGDSIKWEIPGFRRVTWQ